MSPGFIGSTDMEQPKPPYVILAISYQLWFSENLFKLYEHVYRLVFIYFTTRFTTASLRHLNHTTSYMLIVLVIELYLWRKRSAKANFHVISKNSLTDPCPCAKIRFFDSENAPDCHQYLISCRYICSHLDSKDWPFVSLPIQSPCDPFSSEGPICCSVVQMSLPLRHCR